MDRIDEIMGRWNRKPEIEAFDLGNMWFGAQLYKEGLLDDPPMFQMCLGIPWGAPATPLAMQAMKDIMPKEGVWSGFAISRNEMPFEAALDSLCNNLKDDVEKYALNAKDLGYKRLTEDKVPIIIGDFDA